MKTLSLFFRLLLTMVFILFCAGIATFFLSVVMPTEVLNAIKIFENFFAKHLTTAELWCII